MNNQRSSTHQEPGIGAALSKAMLRFLFLVVFMFAVLFLSAGSVKWWEAWVYVAQGLIVVLVGRIYIIRKRPEMALERAEASQREGVQSWDRFLMPFTALYGPLISWVVAGLDFRFGWSPDFPVYIKIIALVVLFLGGMLGNWAMIANPFFSSQVRIQSDRGHQVVSSGPYRFVRHPGYAGGLLAWVAAPFFFGAYSVAVPAVLVMIASFIRTALEDRYLQENLPGYREYSQSVRYRLIPGIW
jgi:protein-S-isoprenylcysteine O-methyltransferase Ste14